MNFRRRVTVTLLALLLLIGAIPVLSQSAQAATTDAYFDELQCAQFPMETLHIVRTNTKLDPDQYDYADPDGGHVHYAFDLSRGSTKVYAPFDLEIVSIGGNSNSVIAQSLRPVRLADGRVDYLTCVFTHDNNISNIKVGKIFMQGTHFYDQGTKGNVDKHLHLEVAIGKPCSKSKSFGSNLQAVRDNGIHVHEAMFLNPDTKISKDYIAYNNSKIRLSWKTRQEIVFHSNVSGMADLTREYTRSELYGSLPTPVNANKVFDGWYTAQKGGMKVTANTKVMSSHTHLYARWKELPVKLNKNVTMMAQSVTETDAKLSMTVKLSAGMNARKAGFYIGTNANYLTKSKKELTVKNTDLSKGVSFQVSDYGFELQPGTKYYYRFYSVINGYEVCSKVASFTTKGVAGQPTTKITPKWSSYKAASITQNGATISAKVTYGKSVKVERVGFYLGTTSNNLKKSTVYDAVNANRTISSISYNLAAKGVKLNPNTTYYYQFYAIVGGKEYKSAVKSFKTKPGQQDTALTPTWSKYNATDITSTNATIGATVNYGKTLKADRCGFYLGTTQTNLKKATKYDTITQSRSYTEMWYDLNKYGQTLKPNTTYYYQFYIVIAGKEYKSAVKSFKTQNLVQQAIVLTPTWSKYNATDITSTNATISATVNYGKTLKADRCGFYLGTTLNNLKKATKYDTISQSRSYTEMWYDLNKYGQTLKPNTTYYYQFYIVIAGKEYKSAAKSFKTQNLVQQAIVLTPTWSKYNAADITSTNATIGATVNYGKTLKADRCGFYLGTTLNNLEKATKYDTISQSRSYTEMWYDLNKYGYTLKPSTTYYYRLYLVVDGKEYLSDVRSFITAKAELSPVWSDYKVSNISKTNATIAGKVTYGKSVTPERCGFYIGTSKDNLEMAKKYDTINASRTYSKMSYGMNKYGYTLKAGTTYYYRFYVIVNGVEYLSDIRSFTTAR